MISRHSIRRSVFTIVSTVTILLLIGLVGPSKAQSPNDSSALSFKEISAELDAGGDFYLIANAENALKDYVGELMSVFDMVPMQDADAAALRQALPKIQPFLNTHGFYAFQGFGLSMVSTANGRSRLKAFVRRDRSKSGSALWLATVGGRARSMAIHSYLPDDVVLVRSGTADPKALRTLADAAVLEFAQEEEALQYQQAKAQATEVLGMSLDRLVNSLGDEALMALLLSKTESVTLPSGTEGEAISIPQPALLVVLKVSDDSLLDVVKSTLAKMEMTLPETTSGDARIYSIPVPMPTPFPVQLTLARQGDHLLLGTTQDAVQRALTAQRDKKGLLQTAEYRQAFGSAPKESNGIIFVGRRLGEALMKVQKTAMQMASGAGLENEMQTRAKFFDRFAKTYENLQVAVTIVNKPNGVSVTGETGLDTRQLVGASLIAPTGLMAAIAIPSFVKARTQSQMNACRNNLRILDACKEQHAIETGLATGERGELSGILEYSKGGVMPVCPKGGVYTLHPIGTDPTCSLPGHTL